MFRTRTVNDIEESTFPENGIINRRVALPRKRILCEKLFQYISHKKKKNLKTEKIGLIGKIGYTVNQDQI